MIKLGSWYIPSQKILDWEGDHFSPNLNIPNHFPPDSHQFLQPPWRSHKFPQKIHQKLLEPAKHPPKNPPKISASARAQHPHTASPGFRSDETWDLSQLRCWEATWMDGWRWDILRYENKVVRKIIPKILGYVLLFQGWRFFDVVAFKMFVWSSIFWREVCTFFGWCWNFLQFYFRGCGKESNSIFLLGMPGMPSFVGDFQVRGSIPSFWIELSIKKAFAITFLDDCQTTSAMVIGS